MNVMTTARAAATAITAMRILRDRIACLLLHDIAVRWAFHGFRLVFSATWPALVPTHFFGRCN